MESLLSFLQELFLGKESENSQIGLTEFKKKQTTIVNAPKKKSIFIRQKPQELRISELVRKGSC